MIVNHFFSEEKVDDTRHDQHIEMLGKMKSNYRELEDSEEYRREKDGFIGLVSAHFERHRQRMAEIMA